MGKGWESETVGSDCDRSENTAWAIHLPSEQTLPVPEQINISLAWKEEQRE